MVSLQRQPKEMPGRLFPERFDRRGKTFLMGVVLSHGLGFLSKKR